MKSILSLVVLAVFVSLANGHGWLIYPAPRGSDLGVGTSSNASTSAPCGQQGEYRDSDVVTVDNLGRLAVSYQTENGHAGNQPDTCTFSLSRTQTGFSTLAGPFPCTPAIYHRNITVFAPDADNGTYYLQFRWRAADGSNWYNCAKLRILAVDLDVAPIIEGVNEVLVPLVTRLYMLNVTAGSFVYIAVGGPLTGSVEVLASLNTIPTPGNKDRNLTVLANQRSAISFCATGQAATLYFAVTTSEASSGPVLVLPSTYSAFTDYTNPKPQITDTLPRGGSKLYSFLSYSTPDIPKRIILTAPAGTGLSQTVGNQCTSKAANPDTIVGSSGPACLDMTTTQGNKYLEVSVPGGSLVPFSITLEAGKCKDLASSAIHLTASFLVIALAFLLAL